MLHREVVVSLLLHGVDIFNRNGVIGCQRGGKAHFKEEVRRCKAVDEIRGKMEGHVYAYIVASFYRRSKHNPDMKKPSFDPLRVASVHGGHSL